MDVRDLYNALRQKVGFEVVSETIEPKRWRILGRIPINLQPHWAKVVSKELAYASANSSWGVDVSKAYFPKPPDGWVYAWRLIFQGESLEAALPEIVQAVIKAPAAPAAKEVLEQPLYGHSGRNALVRGKGAQPAGKAIVGPMALAVKG